jgi:hypothetical protein
MNPEDYRYSLLICLSTFQFLQRKRFSIKQPEHQGKKVIRYIPLIIFKLKSKRKNGSYECKESCEIY